MKDVMIIANGLPVLKFHPTHKRIKDGTPRCIACGQIDEPEIHEAIYCPAMGGDLPFPTSVLKYTLRADNGYRCEGSGRLTLRQWKAVMKVIHNLPSRPMVAGDIGV